MRTKTLITILWGLAAASLIGCSTPRKLAGSTKETAKTEEKRDETTAAEFRRTVDSTKTESVEVTYTKIEFFPPEPDTLPAKQGTTQTGGPSKPVADTPKNRPKEQKEKQPPDNGRQGAIKSIETFTVRQKTEAAGVTQEEQKTETTKTEEVNTDTDRDTDITENRRPTRTGGVTFSGFWYYWRLPFLPSEDKSIYGRSRLLPQIVLAEIKGKHPKGP